MNFSIDIVILLAFLLVNLVVGILYGKSTKDIAEYSLGGRNFSTGALVATIVATFQTGSGFFVTLSKTYSEGLPFLLAMSFFSLQYLVTAMFFIPKMQKFMGVISVAELVGILYGKYARLIAAVTAILWNMGGIAVQFKVFGNVFSYFLEIPELYGIIMASIVVVMYSTFGGIKAVTQTDILQFFTFGFVIPMVGVVTWNYFQAQHLSIQESFSNPLFTFASFDKMSAREIMNFVLIGMYFLVPSFGPIHFQRISMGKDVKQVRDAFLVATLLFIFIDLAMAWIPFLIKNIDPNIAPNQIVNYILDNFTFVGLKGMVMVGICAMAMSSADSFINGSAVLFGHDIKEVLGIDINPLTLSKIFSLVLGVFSIYLAISTDDLLKMVMSSASLYMSTITIPLLFAILGFSTSNLAALSAMGAGIATVIICKNFFASVNEIVPAMVANMVFLFGVHYLTKQQGGWSKVQAAPGTEDGIMTMLRKLILAGMNFNWVKHLQKMTPKNDLSYTWIGIYFIIYSLTTMYSTDFILNSADHYLVLAFYQIMMVTGVVMSTYPIWPLSIPSELKEKFIKIWWYIAVFYMLIFFNGFFVIVSEFSSLQFVVFTVNLLITINLVGWRLSIISIPFGLFASVSLFKYYNSTDDIGFAIGTPSFVFMYSLLLVGMALAIFIKPREDVFEATEEQVTDLIEHNEVLEEKLHDSHEKIKYQEKEIMRLGATAQRILNNVNHELRLPVGNVMNFAELLAEGLGKYSEEQVHEIAQEVFKNSNKLSTMILNMLDLAMLDAKRIELQKSTVNLSELVRDRINHCRRLYLEKKPIDFVLSIQPEILAFIDANYVRQVVDNLLINAMNYSSQGTITIYLHVEDGGLVRFIIEDEGIGIPAENLFDIFEPFAIGNKTYTPASGRGIGLALCKSAVEAHGGVIRVDSNGTVGAKFTFVLPLSRKE